MQVDDFAVENVLDWRDEIFAALKAADIRQVGYVPDAGHARLIELCHGDREIRAVPLTTEEEGVALVAGAWLGGQRAALLMQSSGVGNCINMLSLTRTCRFPLVMLVAMRGEWAEFNPWQVPMGIENASGSRIVRRPGLPRRPARGCRRDSRRSARNRVQWWSGDRRAAVTAADRRKAVGEMTANGHRLDRRAAIRTLLEGRGELLLVTGLGSTTWDAASVGDDERNFYLWGAMGAAAMIGLGLAFARPDRRVLVVTGDGEMLMGLGSLATIGVQRPPNLAIAVFDNGHYGETGMQASHTATAVELIGVAQACGFNETFDISDELGLREFAARIQDGATTLFARVAIRADEPPRVLPPRDGVLMKTRFRRATGVEP